MEHHLAANGQEMELTIRWTKDEDPMGLLNDWAWKGHLDTWLRTLTQPGTAGNPANEGDAYNLAAGLSWLASHTNERLDLLLLILRDQHGASWKTLGTALGVERSSAKSRYTRVAREHARRGDYVDTNGVQVGRPAEVQQRVEARLAARDGQKPAAAEAVSPGIRQQHHIPTPAIPALTPDPAPAPTPAQEAGQETDAEDTAEEGREGKQTESALGELLLTHHPDDETLTAIHACLLDAGDNVESELRAALPTTPTPAERAAAHALTAAAGPLARNATDISQRLYNTTYFLASTYRNHDARTSYEDLLADLAGMRPDRLKLPDTPIGIAFRATLVVYREARATAAKAAL